MIFICLLLFYRYTGLSSHIREYLNEIPSVNLKDLFYVFGQSFRKYLMYRGSTLHTLVGELPEILLIVWTCLGLNGIFNYVPETIFIERMIIIVLLNLKNFALLLFYLCFGLHQLDPKLCELLLRIISLLFQILVLWFSVQVSCLFEPIIWCLTRAGLRTLWGSLFFNGFFLLFLWLWVTIWLTLFFRERFIKP